MSVNESNGIKRAAVDPGKRKALVIAVSKYAEQSGLQPLPFCKNDGEAIYDLLKAHQYEIPDKWKLVGRVPGRKMRESIIDFFFKSAEPNDTLFFYFSGHGVPDPYGDHFLASSDIEQKVPDENGFDFADLENAMKKSPARYVVTTMDCCFSGAAGIGKSGGDMASKARGIMEKVFEDGSGRCVLASSLDGQSSFPMADGEYSMFTYYLLLGLKGTNRASVNSMGNVTPYTLSNFIYCNMPYDEQKPITKTAMSGDIAIASYPELAEPSEEDRQKFSFLYQLLRDGFIHQFNLARKGRLDFSGRHLQRRNLQNADLSRANLQGVNMREADLRGANLSNSNLAGALLEFADLRNANMDGANLDGAALDYAYLHGAKVGNSSSSVFARADFQSILDSESAGVKNVFDLAAAPARTVEVNGHKVRHLAYENPIHSKAPETTIFLHGLAAFSGTWLLMMPSLSKHLRMVVPDMIGFGYSDKPRVSYDLDFFMEFITGMLDTLSLDRVNLVGMSFGARLAAEFAIRFPGRLGKLVLCSPVFIPRFFNAALFSSVVFKMDYKGFFQTFVDGNYFEKDPDAGQVIETSSKIFAEMIKQPDLQYSYQSALSHLAKYPQLKGRLKAISAPTLVVWGEKDRISSVSKADQFGEIPDVRLVTLEDCGHYVCLQRPVEFSREILKFL